MGVLGDPGYMMQAMLGDPEVYNASSEAPPWYKPLMKWKNCINSSSGKEQ